MEQEPKKNKTMTVVGINLGILVFYIVLFRIIENGDGIILAAFAIALHFIACLVLAVIPNYGKAFLLSALTVLLIGFSTCFIAYGIH